MKQLQFFQDSYSGSPAREKTLGVREVLSTHTADEKLLSNLLGPGGKQIAQKLFNTYPSLKLIANVELPALVEIVGSKAAEKVFAITTLATRLLSGEVERINGPEDVFDLMRPKALLDKEHFWVISLNTKLFVIGVHEIYKGSVNAITQFRPAELFRPAIAVNATAIICVHNHPTASVVPSPEDISTTREIVRVGRMLDVQVADHIIIGDGFCSLRKRNPSAFAK